VLLRGKPIAQCIVSAGETVRDRAAPFDFLGSHIDLAEADSKREVGFEAMLREALEDIRSVYDFVVIDAPPHLGLLTWMALTAADKVIIPVRTEPPDVMGVGLLLETIKKFRGGLMPISQSRAFCPRAMPLIKASIARSCII